MLDYPLLAKNMIGLDRLNGMPVSCLCNCSWMKEKMLPGTGAGNGM